MVPNQLTFVASLKRTMPMHICGRSLKFAVQEPSDSSIDIRHWDRGGGGGGGEGLIPPGIIGYRLYLMIPM